MTTTADNCRLLREELQRTCPHEREDLRNEGSTGMLGRVVCLDCGREREWNAY